MEKTGQPQGLELSDLAEFPIAALDADTTRRVMEHGNGEKRLRVQAHPEVGMPTGEDVAVLLGLLYFSRDRDIFDDFTFRPRELLARIGWGDQGHRYDRLALALDRWKKTELVCVNSVHNVNTGAWERRAHFSLLDSYVEYRRLGDGSRGRGSPPWEFTWSSTVIHLLMDRRFMHDFDIDTYAALSGPVAQALFRYLYARLRDGKPFFSQHLKTLAGEHLGLRQEYPSQIKRALQPGLDQLVARGVLREYTWGTMEKGPLRGEPKLTVIAARKRKAAPPPPPRQTATRNAPEPRRAAPRPPADTEPLGELAQRFLGRDPDRAARFAEGLRTTEK